MRKRVRTAVIPVAGLGTRFTRHQNHIPKEMPLLDRPCIDYIVTEAGQRVDRTDCLCHSTLCKDAMIDYYDSAPALESHLAKHGKYKLLEMVEEASNRVDAVIAIRQQASVWDMPY